MRGDSIRIVADSDVLCADLFIDGAAREAMDLVRAHDWVTLVASDALVDDAEEAITRLSEPQLAADWRVRIDDLRESVEGTPGDHPALSSAYRGEAAHVLSFDDRLRSAETAARLRSRLSTSVKHPAGFVRLFDAASLYEAVVGGEYPGPDRDPRA
ncbi:DUF7384 family protein [Natronorarus salvus]|uniref:DUF7384 family protein n=1 Tax=Natronorarus salvus TaxID=3117733 RepID=UPI002F26822A